VPPYDEDIHTPQRIYGITGPTALTIGEYHVCGLLPNGTVKCWGDDSEGQLGDGLGGRQSATPLSVVGLNGVTSIAAGLELACAIAGDGLTHCWGYGALGNAGTTPQSNTPVVVMGLPDAQKLPSSAGTRNNIMCAIRADGSIACWGGQMAAPVTATW